MDIAVIKRLGFAAMAIVLCASAAFARPPEGARGSGQAADFRPQGGNNFNNGGGRQSSSEEDANRRRGKLSPDERRELRRQIDEAGQDIYRVKR